MTERIAPECGCSTTGKIVRGMCATHYDRWVHVTPKDQRGPAPRFSRSFWDFVDKSGDCWLWTGPANRKGYGYWSGNGERGLAHRIALASVVPSPLPDLFACHHCDNPPCVNPAHLYWGTAADNSRDVVERQGIWNKGHRTLVCPRGHEIVGANARRVGDFDICRECDNARSRERQRKVRAASPPRLRRTAVGERHGMARLTWAEVRELRRLHGVGESAVTLARQYRISETHVWRIIAGKVWREDATDGAA